MEQTHSPDRYPASTSPDGAAGLPAGTYSFQVTDPSGKALLSTDAPECRQFTVNDFGVIGAVVAVGRCEHATGADGEDGGATGYSKTDKFKVRNPRVVEIDTRFYRPGSSAPVDGLNATWIDTNGASNVKYSEYDPARLAFHEAHVEAAEQGSHQIVVSDQAGCAVDSVQAGGRTYSPAGGSVTVPVAVKNHQAGDATYFVAVLCGG